MPTHRYTEIPADALSIIETLAGPVLKAVTVSTGLNSEIAARIYNNADEIVFVKGMRVDHPRVWTQEREAAINAYVQPLAPAMLWHVLHGGWDLLCFEEIDGPHAGYEPGSPHLPLVAEAMQALAGLPMPDLPLKTMPDRMRSYSDTPDLFAGEQLLHTDWNPHNVLIADGRARLVDWAWAARGAAWIDPALWVIWLIASGHTPEQAERLAAECTAFADAPGPSLNAFARAQNRMWDEIAGDAPDAWTATMQTAAAGWHRHRSGRVTS
ncbi:aminoglycoside phosphotransferase [Streptomyces sp. NPDC046977]|uniref:aminoglycoside phosphotransferase n=1 Tax=Streptomyces sp. NPDC046977 TaxID=3154703 RepID=UPI0033F3517F